MGKWLDTLQYKMYYITDTVFLLKIVEYDTSVIKIGIIISARGILLIELSSTVTYVDHTLIIL